MTAIFADVDHILTSFCTKIGQFMDNSDSLGPLCALLYIFLVLNDISYYINASNFHLRCILHRIDENFEDVKFRTSDPKAMSETFLGVTKVFFIHI